MFLIDMILHRKKEDPVAPIAVPEEKTTEQNSRTIPSSYFDYDEDEEYCWEWDDDDDDDD